MKVVSGSRSRGLVVASISTLFLVSAATPALAATRPTVTWKVTSLLASTKVPTSSLVTTNSTGKRTWSVSGACTLSRGSVVTNASGKCTITLRLAARSRFAARTVKKAFTITPKSLPPVSIDTYAGTNPAVTATGKKSQGTVVTSDGRTRKFRTYVPASLPKGQSVPLVIGLHGGLGTSAQFEANSGLDELAESNRFIVVYPDGIGNQPDGTGLQTWNGGYCCGPAAAQGVDDVGFIFNLIVDLLAQYPIDQSRIFAMGHSNGGIFAYTLACKLSDLIAAIGVQAGSNVVTGCSTLGSPVSVIHLHGTADTNMPIGGGTGSGVSGTVFVPARDAVEAMARANGCDVALPQPLTNTNPDVTGFSWSKCTDGAEVRFITVKGASHAWMGHPAQSPGSSSYVGDPYPNLDATRTIISFFLGRPAQ